MAEVVHAWVKNNPAIDPETFDPVEDSEKDVDV